MGATPGQCVEQPMPWKFETKAACEETGDQFSEFLTQPITSPFGGDDGKRWQPTDQRLITGQGECVKAGTHKPLKRIDESSTVKPTPGRELPGAKK